MDIALDHLSLGRAEVQSHKVDGSGDLAEAGNHLNQAVDSLRKAGRVDYVPFGLLERAAYLRVAEQYDRAQRDLDEAMHIATRSGMRLHDCDAHLELARLELAQGNREAARNHLAQAKSWSRQPAITAATGGSRS